jgi:hypothetical protein
VKSFALCDRWNSSQNAPAWNRTVRLEIALLCRVESDCQSCKCIVTVEIALPELKLHC